MGVADLLNYQSITDKQVSSEIMNRLPLLIEKQCKIRVGDDSNDVESDDDLAEEEKLFGMDENTHIMGWNRPQLNQRQNQAQQQQQQQDMEDEE